MTREIGLGFLSGSCSITDISLGQLCLRVSLEPVVGGSWISVLESRRDAAPEEVVQVRLGAHQQPLGIWWPQTVTPRCPVELCEELPLPGSRGQSSGLAGSSTCFIWPTAPFLDGTGNGGQAPNSPKRWARFQTVDTALPKLLSLPLIPRKGRQEVWHVWSRPGGIHLCTCEETSKLEHGLQGWQG